MTLIAQIQSFGDMIMHYVKNMMSMMNAWVEHPMNELIKKNM